MRVRNEKQKKVALEAGRRLRKVLDAVISRIQQGVCTKDLDQLAYDLIIAGGDEPAFLNYRPSGAAVPFPATLCVSINEEMVHGVPSAERYVKEGDLVSVDCGLNHEGVFVDAACTVIVGDAGEQAKNLVEATRKALQYALVAARSGATTGDVGHAVETIALSHGYTVPPELGGHGVGASQHEDPFIPNIGDPGQGDVFQSGDMVAIEPIFSMGDSPHIALGADGFAYRTDDGSLSAHFEHTLIITDGTPLIVTGPMW